MKVPRDWYDNVQKMYKQRYGPDASSGVAYDPHAHTAASATVDSSDVRLDETPAPQKSPASQSPELKRVSSERIVRARIDEAKKNKTSPSSESSESSFSNHSNKRNNNKRSLYFRK